MGLRMKPTAVRPIAPATRLPWEDSLTSAEREDGDDDEVDVGDEGMVTEKYGMEAR